MFGVSLRIVSAGLAFCLFAGQPVSLLAQQATPAPQTTPAPPDQNQAPTADRQQQQDKAGQQLINGKPESGVQLPPSPDAIQEQAAKPATAPVNPVEQPTGTAAAQEGRLAGNIASRPAGVAVAPAKQRQVRSILIKTGIVAAAGVAIGTVYGLSKASSSTPPGAR